MRGEILATARDAGRDPGEITCCYNLEVRIGERDPRPDVVSGSPDEVAQSLDSFVRLGFTAFNFFPVGPGEDEQRKRLAREVIPAVRAGR
jgi:alkanesulfonate monooxygenase SsuD/methylene tetrahydromethanopterin reductase-like flavin-dependent oxidoreductase (luciferase family)